MTSFYVVFSALSRKDPMYDTEYEVLRMIQQHYSFDSVSFSWRNAQLDCAAGLACWCSTHSCAP